MRIQKGRVGSQMKVQDFKDTREEEEEATEEEVQVLDYLQKSLEKGHRFTWSNGREAENLVEQRLDSPLRSVWSRCQEDTDKRKERIFRFEKIWVDDPRFRACVARAWSLENAHCPNRIALTSRELISLNKEVGSHTQHLRRLEAKIIESDTWPSTPDNIAKRKDLLTSYDDILRQDEVYWMQRSRALWLKEGDKNATFFHSKASMRQRVNKIKRLKDETGSWVYGQGEQGRSFNNILITFLSPLLLKMLRKICASSCV
ncbi:ribonuclease H [Sesbania bispinosa]|nr:ribonuclease H [Sesbania bispinosa]